MTDRFERLALAALLIFTAAAVAGYATFGVHPELLRGNPMAQRVYGASFVLFARGQVMLSAAVLIAVLVRRSGRAWLTAFAAIYLVSLSSELAGTTVGLPFGPYSYTDGLGPKWFGHVPLLIPLSWFLMAVPSYAIARRLAVATTTRILAGSLVLLSWDLALDPAMSFATKYWVWGGTNGAFYGMPWLNLFGWYVTGLALMTILAVLHAGVWIGRVPLSWMAGYYVANLLIALGMCVAAGLWGAAGASLLPLALCAFALRPERLASPRRTREAVI